MNNGSPHTLQFGQYKLDVDCRSLERGGRHLPLRPQAMEVLCYLAKNPGRPISKEELFREIWPGISVTDDSLVQCIGDIRHVLEDNDHRIVKTVPRRGYLFAGVALQDNGPGRQEAKELLVGGGTKKFNLREIKFALMLATGILVVWGIVHWFVSAR